MKKNDYKNIAYKDRNAIRTRAAQNENYPAFAAICKRRRISIIAGLKEEIKKFLKGKKYNNMFVEFRAQCALKHDSIENQLKILMNKFIEWHPRT